jgi:site-specific DNA recombinase
MQAHSSTSADDRSGKTYAAYLRVSSKLQEKKNTSIPQQRKQVLDWATANGVSIPDELIIAETGDSESIYDRDRLIYLWDLLRQERADGVVILDPDRLSRNPAHQLVLLSEWRNHLGLDVVFLEDGFDDSDTGVLLQFVNSWGSHKEHKDITRRINRGKNWRLNDLHLPLVGRRPPFGWLLEDRTIDKVLKRKAALVLDPDTSPIRRRLIDEALAGKPLRQIASELTADRIATPSGKAVPWRPSTISQMLRDPIQKGEPFSRKTETLMREGHKVNVRRPREGWVPVADGTPSLCTAEEYEDIQKLLEDNKARALRNNKHPDVFLLRGHVFCGYCGKQMTCTWGHNKKTPFPIYRCTATMLKPRQCAEGSAINADKLHAHFWERLGRLLSSKERVEQEMKALRTSDPTTADLAAIDRTRAQLAERIEGLQLSLQYVKTAEAAQLLAGQLDQLIGQRAQLDEDRERILARRAAWELDQERLDQVQDWCDKVGPRIASASFEEKRWLVYSLDVEVKVYRSDHEPPFTIDGAIPLGDEPRIGPIVSSTTYSSSRRRRIRPP